MNASFLDPGGLVLPSNAISQTWPRQVMKYLTSGFNAYARLVECRSDGGAETVIFDVDVELAQLSEIPIAPQERIAAVFRPRVLPKVLALRPDFPPVPHLNLQTDEFPRSLCLYEQQFSEVKLKWTAPNFVADIQKWLSETARGKLHKNDQSLEPLLPGTSNFIVLPDHPDKFKDSELLFSKYGTSMGKHFLTFQAEARGRVPIVPCFRVFVLECTPLTHGVIRRIPLNLKALQELTMQAGYDLLDNLRAKLKAVVDDKALNQNWFLLIVRFPKRRWDGGPVEVTDTYVFSAQKSVWDVGVAIGVFAKIDGHYGLEPIFDKSKFGDSIGVEMLAPLTAFNRTTAALLNGLDSVNEQKITAIGSGAIGAQVILNLARSGLGSWTIIDNDVLFPHNLARHALSGRDVGKSKAEALAAVICDMLNDPQAAKALPINALQPDNADGIFTAAMNESELILDMSASPAVARHLALDITCKAKRVSFFLAPSATDAVLLAEDAERHVPLDSLEMQYYRALINDPHLTGHLGDTQKTQRYGRTCSDTSFVAAQHLFALHAAIGSRAIQEVCESGQARIRVWRADPNSLAVNVVDVPVAATVTFAMNAWKLVSDKSVFRKLSKLRRQRLPNETGGILLGCFDCSRNIIYIVEALTSPPDSEHWPDAYIRGCQGLSKAVEEASKKTNSAVSYVGEWHSHPNGATVNPSVDDEKLFKWLHDHMAHEGHPALLVIAGDRGKYGVYIGDALNEGAE